MVLVGPRRDHGGRQGRQHGGAAAGRGGRRARRSSASSPPSRSRRFSPWSPGLTLSGAAALSHDLWVNVVRGGEAAEREQLRRRARRDRGARRRRRSCSGIAFKGQNVAFMVGLAFAIAASANFPALVLSMFWRRFTTRGAQAQHARRDRLGAAADLPVADDPGDILSTRSAPVPAPEPRARHDPAVVRRRDRGLAADARARGRRALRFDAAAAAPRARGRPGLKPH